MSDTLQEWKLPAGYLREKLSLRKYKRRKEMLNHQDWYKVGKVKNLFMYPLVMGNGENVTSCYIDDNELVGYKTLPIQNHMFVMYDERTDLILMADDMNIKNVTISVRDENTAILKYENMEYIYKYENTASMVLKNFKDGKDRRTCAMPYHTEIIAKVEILDCGKEATAWLKRHTKNDYVRLGYILRSFGPHKIFTSLYHKIHSMEDNDKNEDKNNAINDDDSTIEDNYDKITKVTKVPFENLPSFTLLSDASFDKVNETMFHDMSTQDLCPNIIISTISGKPFSEMNWKRIKIGEAIVNNANMWGKSQSDFKYMPIRAKKKNLLLHCEVLFPGLVKEYDDVYVLREENDEL